MDRKVVKLPFNLGSSPDWSCPTCQKGTLRLRKDTFVKEELRRSREVHSHEAWEPEWIEYVYTCLLICSDEQCKEAVATGGIGFVDYDIVADEHGEQGQVWTEFFLPKYFELHLKLANVPNGCPESVILPLNESFKLFFVSPSAALTNVRVAVEELLTELKISRFATSKGKRRHRNLHERINLLPEKYEQFKDMILAIKWLGNAGSHGHGEVTMDDVMDAYELMEYVLEEVYMTKLKKLKGITKKVNKRRGPSK